MTLPVFVTLNETSNAGRCSQMAVEPPSTLGDGSPSAHAASSPAEVWSAWCTVRTWRFEYEKVVYESPKPKGKRGSMLFYARSMINVCSEFRDQGTSPGQDFGEEKETVKESSGNDARPYVSVRQITSVRNTLTASKCL